MQYIFLKLLNYLVVEKLYLQKNKKVGFGSLSEDQTLPIIDSSEITNPLKVSCVL